MGYPIDSIALYEISTNKMIPVELPNEESKSELILFIENNAQMPKVLYISEFSDLLIVYKTRGGKCVKNPM